MAISLTSPVSVPNTTGFTTATATVAVDQAPDSTAKAWYVTAWNGTVPGTLRAHSASDPCRVTFWRDKIIKVLGQLGLNGQFSSVPVNKYKVVVQKGVLVAANQPSRQMIVRLEVECPAGAELYDLANVRGGLVLASGSLTQQITGLGDTIAAGAL
jgi:hypothetical protein